VSTAVYRITTADEALDFECAAHESVLAAAERAGWALPASCRAGVCGSCEGEVLSGTFVTPGRQDLGPQQEGPASAVKLCRVRPCSDLRIAPREVHRRDLASEKVITAKVLRIERPAAEVAVLKLRFPAGVRAKFRAGQYLRVLLDDGQERSFSMANPPQQSDGVELHIRYLEGGRFAEQVFHQLQPGDPVRLRLPLGDFYLRESEAPIVFVAGGTGFAPVQSILEELLKKGTQRRLHLYVGARTPELLYRHALAQRWADAGKTSYVPVVSAAAAADGGWSGRTGRVHEAVVEDLPDLSGHEVYACGSPAMVAAAREAFAQRGLDPARFYCDAFAPSRDVAM
jgi:NAD(P)H-flavin reductase/ferredoxin